MRHRPEKHGFSLVELMVAMAIFIVIMSGVVVLYNGAVSSVRTGYRAIDGFELGRTTLSTIERDIKNAFTAREYGDYYQFYGRPEGFMFVGMLENNRMGRITYTIAPDRGPTFESDMAESLGILLGHAIRQGGTNMAFSVLYYFADSGQVDNVTVYEDRIDGADMSTEAGVQAAAESLAAIDDTVEFDINVYTSSLRRFEEPGVSDLDTFRLPGVPGDLPNECFAPKWPFVDLTDPSRDDWSEIGGQFYNELISALTLPDGTDMRDALRDSYYFDLAPTYLNLDVLEQILAAKKREIWIRILADDPTLVKPPPAFSLLPYFWGSCRDGASDVPPAADFVIASNIVNRVQIVVDDPLLREFNVIGEQQFFSYSDGDGNVAHYFNSLEKIGGYPYLMANDGRSPVDRLRAFDYRLGNDLGGAVFGNTTLGSPLAPKIPEMVGPAFWVMLERPQVNSPDFKHHFSLLIDVPASNTRGLPTTMVPRAGSA